MRNKFNAILVAASITFAIMLSFRVVWIPTPLNVAEQFGILGIMFDYTMRRSKDLEKKDDTN